MSAAKTRLAGHIRTTGGPAFRYRDGTAELIGIHSTSWRGGCLGETETRGEATEVRVDDIGSWISQTTLGLSP